MGEDLPVVLPPAPTGRRVMDDVEAPRPRVRFGGMQGSLVASDRTNVAVLLKRLDVFVKLHFNFTNMTNIVISLVE
jgi:hypothetical protein